MQTLWVAAAFALGLVLASRLLAAGGDDYLGAWQIGAGPCQGVGAWPVAKALYTATCAELP
jgi:hypothetical protein